MAVASTASIASLRLALSRSAVIWSIPAWRFPPKVTAGTGDPSSCHPGGRRSSSKAIVSWEAALFHRGMVAELEITWRDSQRTGLKRASLLLDLPRCLSRTGSFKRRAQTTESRNKLASQFLANPCAFLVYDRNLAEDCLRDGATRAWLSFQFVAKPRQVTVRHRGCRC
jgi:hypothetical protein